MIPEIIRQAKNFIFVGEAGCGKSEISINVALLLHAMGREVQFFDLDQTKPLFRSRDVKNRLEKAGIRIHYEEQFYDAPTLVGGVSEALGKVGCCCILDVGGNDTGSRAIGGFAPYIQKEDTIVFFVVNPYRPWSNSIVAIDETLSAILHAAHLQDFRIICNPNVGKSTTAGEAVEGLRKTQVLLGTHATIDLITANETIAKQVKACTELDVLPLQLFLMYPWCEPA